MSFVLNFCGLAIYNAVFMLTSVSGIITICVLYAMVVKKIYKQRKKFSKNNRRSDSLGSKKTAL
jgi:flagellar biogenesis protein FliO